MTVLAQWELQKSVYEALTADTVLMGLVTGVYDAVPENTPFPYILLGECKSNDWLAQSFQGQEVVLAIYIYSKERGKKECISVMERIYNVLHDAGLAVSGATLVSMRMISSSVMPEDDGVTFMGAQKFRALLHDR